jgi:hypothetical protein
VPHPIERLRWIARAEGETAAALAGEAAWTLGELAVAEPAALVTASRRLVERLPGCGPLWWACAHMLATDDPIATARLVAARLASDAVGDRLADALRCNFTSSDRLAATVPVDTLYEALARRHSYCVRLVADRVLLGWAVRALGAVAEEVVGYRLEEAGVALEGAAALIVEPSLAAAEVASGSRLVRGRPLLLVEPGVVAVVDQAAALSVPVWIVLGVGRVLPPALAAAASELAGGELARLDPSPVVTAVDAAGLAPIDEALSRVDCPSGAELLHRGRRPR